MQSLRINSGEHRIQAAMGTPLRQLLSAHVRYIWKNKQVFTREDGSIDQMCFMWQILGRTDTFLRASAYFSWYARTFDSAIKIVSPHESVSEIRFTLLLFVSEQPGPSSSHQRSFIRGHYDNWCLSGLSPFIFSFHFCHWNGNGGITILIEK